MQADIIPNLPGQQRMLFRRIIADQQNGRRVEHIPHAGSHLRLAAERGGESREVRSAMMVDIVGLQVPRERISASR